MKKSTVIVVSALAAVVSFTAYGDEDTERMAANMAEQLAVKPTQNVSMATDCSKLSPRQCAQLQKKRRAASAERPVLPNKVSGSSCFDVISPEKHALLVRDGNTSYDSTTAISYLDSNKVSWEDDSRSDGFVTERCFSRNLYNYYKGKGLVVCSVDMGKKGCVPVRPAMVLALVGGSLGRGSALCVGTDREWCDKNR